MYKIISEESELRRIINGDSPKKPVFEFLRRKVYELKKEREGEAIIELNNKLIESKKYAIYKQNKEKNFFIDKTNNRNILGPSIRKIAKVDFKTDNEYNRYETTFLYPLYEFLVWNVIFKTKTQVEQIFLAYFLHIHNFKSTSIEIAIIPNTTYNFRIAYILSIKYYLESHNENLLRISYCKIFKVLSNYDFRRKSFLRYNSDFLILSKNSKKNIYSQIFKFQILCIQNSIYLHTNVYDKKILIINYLDNNKITQIFLKNYEEERIDILDSVYLFKYLIFIRIEQSACCFILYVNIIIFTVLEIKSWAVIIENFIYYKESYFMTNNSYKNKTVLPLKIYYKINDDGNDIEIRNLSYMIFFIIWVLWVFRKIMRIVDYKIKIQC